MLKGPSIRLSIDLARMDRYFPLDHGLDTGIDQNLSIDRKRYDKVVSMLEDYDISDERIIQETCFIIHWIQEEIGESKHNPNSQFIKMRTELDELKSYLLNHRITSIALRGEYERNKPDADFILREETNIDRVCDGLRSVFREEFSYSQKKRRSKGLTAWQRRKIASIKNNILNYLNAIPVFENLSLENQNQIIDRIINLANIHHTN